MGLFERCRCHNPVAADIDVTDNCFCTVFFAGLYLSSSFSKTAIIFHKNNEVFVNCEIGCKSTCSTISLFLRSLICTYSADDLRPLMLGDEKRNHHGKPSIRPLAVHFLTPRSPAR